MPTTKIGEINLCYKTYGNGQPLIMITGFASAQNTLFSLARAFSKHYSVITFDNRGIGGSDKPACPYNTNMMAQDTIGLMDFLGIQKAYLMGGSMGGMVAQNIAIDYPQRVDKLVLFSTSADGQWLFDLIKSTIPNWNNITSDLTPSEIRKLVSAMALRTSNQPITRFMFVVLSRLQARVNGLTGLTGQIGAMLRHDTMERLNQIQAPTLIMTGCSDRLIAPYFSEVLASRIKGSKLVRIDRGSHVVAGEMAGKFISEVLNFLSA
jgi:3-oxoadipate enol-lactonase